MSASSAAPTVVIVEDDVALLQALRFMFLSEGFQAQACESAAALVALDFPAAPTCLIVDERLPDGSGLAAVAQLRERGVTAPALLVTTAPDEALLAAAGAARVHVVGKPLLGKGLLDNVRRLLDGGLAG